MTAPYDAVLLVSFGGPEHREEVMPFLENVLRGKNVPRERLLEVAEHYYHFGGLTPINEQNRQLITALEAELAEHGPKLPIYWGNRNWRPLLTEAVRQMRADGVERALAIVTSAFSSYSGCRQYLENIEAARRAAGDGAPAIHKLRAFCAEPKFIAAVADRCRPALEQLPAAHLIFTAHSIPVAMAASSPYEDQLREACARVAAELGRPDWRLVYQSRSGPPAQPWLGPDILDYLRPLSGRDVVIAPIGFLSDHMEVLYDLDTEARALCEELGIRMVRAATVGTHPLFVTMLREMIAESSHAVCAPDCCLPPAASGRPR